MSENIEMQTCPSCGDLVPNEYTLCVWCGFDLTAEHIRRAGINITNRDALERMRRVILSPLTAFKEISLLPDLRGPKMLFYGIAFVMTLNMIAVLGKIDDLAYNGESAIFLSTTRFDITTRMVLNLIYLVLQPLVLYLIFYIVWRWSARILSALSKTFGGKGDREKIRSMVGYSMVPVFLAWSVSWLLRLISPSSSAGSDPSYDDIETAVIAVSEEGFGVVSQAFLWIGWLWALGLGVIGMKNVGRLSWFEAAIVAGIPYAVFISIAM